MEDEEKKLPMTLKLLFPFKYGEEQVTEIVLERRLRASDLRSVPKSVSDEVKTLHFIKCMTGWNDRKIDKLDLDDLAAVSEELASFLTRSPQTGKDA